MQPNDDRCQLFFSQSFQNHFGEKLLRTEPLPPQGSDRKYYRLIGSTKSAIAAVNGDWKENDAFLSFSRHFKSLGLPVPEILAEDLSIGAYIEEDLGDLTLFSYLTEERKEHGFSDAIIEVYKKALTQLPRFQVLGAKGLDYNKCYPRSSFDLQSMMWDLNYFKYYFLKLSGVRFDEQALENDYEVFTKFLLSSDCEYFLYRDFQSRNIMLVEGEPYFIDYQGGRKGALQYDVASLLYDAKADIPQEVRLELLEHYLTELEKLIPVDRKTFLEYYYGYVLIRIMQALGAYGYRGYYQRKEHFLLSIPYAIKNLKWLLDHVTLPLEIPMLRNVWEQLIEIHLNRPQNLIPKLTVQITSFSFRKGYPEDTSGNGGGFVFDCRGLHNPGRYQEYVKLTGNDEPVIEFLRKEDAVEEFLSHVFSLVDSTVDNYRSRNFSNLSVSFGCTGGQHRSVYCANRLVQHLKTAYDINIKLTHREIERMQAQGIL